MRVVQYRTQGDLRLAVLTEGGDEAVDVGDGLWAAGGSGLAGAITCARREGASLAELLSALEADSRTRVRVDLEGGAVELDTGRARLAPPVCGAEVWGAGVTYLRSRTAREAESAIAADVYARVYDAPRPELFLKDGAASRRVVGPGDAVGVRADSRATVPEPEFALILDADGRIVALTLADDVTARDIEGDNPLYLPQAKVFAAACALGPCALICESELPELELTMEVRDGSGATLFAGRASTGSLRRRPEDLVAYLCRSNPIEDGTVLMTGTGIVPPNDFGLEDGHEVRIACSPIGVLANRVSRLGEDAGRPAGVAVGRTA
jgi:2-dehydro-3-deoxy-D-arabinonate dehydratase